MQEARSEDHFFKADAMCFVSGEETENRDPASRKGEKKLASGDRECNSHRNVPAPVKIPGASEKQVRQSQAMSGRTGKSFGSEKPKGHQALKPLRHASNRRFDFSYHRASPLFTQSCSWIELLPL